jgi:hypothetical protein
MTIKTVWDPTWAEAEIARLTAELERLTAELERARDERAWACEEPCGKCCGCLAADAALSLQPDDLADK